MTEAQIEAVAERRMDALDRKLLAGTISTAVYNSLVKELDEWCRAQRHSK